MAPPADDADTSGEKATFPWLAAARYAVAVAVAVLIVTVIARATVVCLRRDEPKISVVGGFIAASREDYFPSVRGLAFTYTLRAINPSGRVRIYFTNITSYLTVKNATSPAQGLAGLKLPDMALNAPPEELRKYVRNTLNLTEGIMSTWRSSYFELLHNDNTSSSYIPDAMLRLNGTVITEVYSGHNRTDPVPTVFCCSPLTIGGDPAEHTAVDDAQCHPNDQTCYH